VLEIITKITEFIFMTFYKIYGVCPDIFMRILTTCDDSDRVTSYATMKFEVLPLGKPQIEKSS
jgi:hypothetical protein